MISLAQHAEGVVLAVLAQPGANRNAILGERAGALRVAVTAPPERGKANQAIQALLADALAWRTSRIVLLSGTTSRQKRFLIEGIDSKELSARLRAVVPEPKSSPSRS